MFEDVQHQDKRILLAGLESLIEWADMDAVAIRVVRADHIGGHFDPLNVAELRQFAEKQSISATDVENRAPSARRLVAAKKLDDQFFARSKPPVTFVEFAVPLAEFRVQRK